LRRAGGGAADVAVTNKIATAAKAAPTERQATGDAGERAWGRVGDLAEEDVEQRDLATDRAGGKAPAKELGDRDPADEDDRLVALDDVGERLDSQIEDSVLVVGVDENVRRGVRFFMRWPRRAGPSGRRSARGLRSPV
jgi:hypothetical protein